MPPPLIDCPDAPGVLPTRLDGGDGGPFWREEDAATAAVPGSRPREGFLWAVGHAALSTFCGRNSQRERTRSGVAITSSPAWSNGRQREEPVLSDRLDTLARAVAEHTTRRTALVGPGALALGSLGLRRIRQEAEAKNKNN
jgi:hypothetical protein